MQRPRLVLASGSPRRLELLASVGVDPLVLAPEVDETPMPGEAAVDLAVRLAATKAAAVSVEPNDVVVGFDTIVIVDGDPLGKPSDLGHARDMLHRLSGRTHQVVTAVCVKVGDWSAVEPAVAAVTFRTLNDDDVDWYLSTGEPMGKAGSYAIQGAGALFVTEINGNYSGVVGLPLPLVDELLGRIGRPLLSWVGT